MRQRRKAVDTQMMGTWEVRLMDDGTLYVTSLTAIRGEEEIHAQPWPQARIGSRVHLSVVRVA